MLSRRRALILSVSASFARRAMSATTLASCPIEVRGDWHAAPDSALAVITRVRAVALARIALHSDHQPDRIWVENKSSGYPSIWLHDRPARSAWIMTNAGARAWCQLVYQFGHELGHVTCNSWEHEAVAPPPCRWLEEALAESFSLRALDLLAQSWATEPPFPGDNAYAEAIRQYRGDILRKYEQYAHNRGATDLRAWFEGNEAQLDREEGLDANDEPAVPAILGLIEPEPILIEDYGALNRWPERSALPLPAYLRAWQASCLQLGLLGRLPAVLADLLGVSLG